MNPEAIKVTTDYLPSKKYEFLIKNTKGEETGSKEHLVHADPR
jgi:hypothetical protein